MLVSLAIKIAFDAFYEVFGRNDSTNWVIMHHVVNYLLISSILMFISQNTEHIKAASLLMHIAFIRWLTHILGMLYVSYAAIELTYINVHFKIYTKAMSEGYFKLNYGIVVAVAITFYALMYQFKKKTNTQWI